MTNEARFDRRSVVTAVLVLLLGASLGFAVGYKYEKPAKKATTSAATASATPAQQQAARQRAMIIYCMALKGVKYPPNTNNIGRPPAGVTQSKYRAALGPCWNLVVKKKPTG